MPRHQLDSDMSWVRQVINNMRQVWTKYILRIITKVTNRVNIDFSYVFRITTQIRDFW